MTRSVAALLTLASLLATAPVAQATHRARPSHVPACAAMPGAPCQALIRNWRPSMTRLVVLKEMMR